MMTPTVDRAPFLETGIASQALTGESMSGDAFTVCPTRLGALVAVVDGLGHGVEAAAAARRAVDVLHEHCEQSAITLVRRCHQALVGTRGAALTLAAFNHGDETLTWLAVGNVDSVLLRADPASVPARETIVMRGGVVGARLPLLRAAMINVVEGDVLILATDGIRAGFAESLDVTLPAQRLADEILAGQGRGTDDALVLVARYLGRRPA